ncbi:MAG TPA: XdhC family protein [Jiangellales bacterium]|nr:XdhC family protein [Jiangellales bacterium]
MTGTDPACAAAHGLTEDPAERRRLVAVFASAVATHLLHFGRHLGYETVLLEPEPGQVSSAYDGVVAADPVAAGVDGSTDVVVTDHDRPDLGPVLREVLRAGPRWVGVMGALRHTAPHVAALAELGVPPADVARVRRPIGLDIGSRTPPEIAIATLAGLVADRRNRPGGFDFGAAPSGSVPAPAAEARPEP